MATLLKGTMPSRPLITIDEPETPPIYEFTDYHFPQSRVSHTVQKPMFRYKVSLGHFPKEAESYVFVKRKNPITKEVKIVPQMVYPLEANRIPLPKHQVLEDDWRAFRSVYHNYQALIRSQMDPIIRGTEMLKLTFIITDQFKFHPRNPRQLIVTTHKRDIAPVLDVYKDQLDPPSGYMYRRYKGQNQLKPPPPLTPHGIPLQLPVVVFEGPYVDKTQVPHGKLTKMKMDKEWDYFDSDVIIGGPAHRELYMYNEPDAVPLSFIRTNFSQSLPQRIIKLVTADLADEGEPQAVPKVPLPVLSRNRTSTDAHSRRDQSYHPSNLSGWLTRKF